MLTFLKRSFFPSTHLFIQYLINKLYIRLCLPIYAKYSTMATSFSQLPIVDVGALREPELSAEKIDGLSKQLYNVFSTTGFAYLTNVPLSFNHEEIFALAREFFALPVNEKMQLAKKSFHAGHENTYRGCVIMLCLVGSALAYVAQILPSTAASCIRQSKRRI